jgi:hypothetical protein
MTIWPTAVHLVVGRLIRGRLLIGVAGSCVLLLAWAAPAWARAVPVGATASLSGSLTVRIVGLPPGQSVHGVLRGPDGLERSVSTARLTISKARPGVYRLTLRAVTISHAHGSIEKGASARPVPGTTTVRVRAGHRASLVGTYGTIINPGVKTLQGGAISVTGPPEDPTSVVLSGHQAFAPNAIISMPPSVQLPRGLLDHVTAVSYNGGNTVLSLTAASIYEVAPNFQFDIPLQEPGATAADFSAGADCGLPAGLSPYRHIKDVSFSGGWSTVDVFGVHVTDGVRASVHFTVEAGLEVTAGAGLSCSLNLAFNASGMAGPIPVTAGIEGDLSGSAGVGGVLKSGGSIEVSAGGHTVGFPPAMALIPDVSFDNPHFTMTAKQFAQATAGIGVTVKAGVGVGGAASLTLNVGSSLNFTAQPGSCLWNAKFGQFSAEGELLKWHLSTPQTPALFTKQLGGNFCATSGSGGGSGSGGSGGGGSGGGGSTPPGGGGGGGETPGAGWNLESPPGLSSTNSGLGSISCVAANWCLALAGNENSALTEIWNGSSWSAAAEYPEDLSSVTCLSTSWCMGVGGVDATWNGSSWTQNTMPAPSGSPETYSYIWVSCASVSYCVAVGDATYSGGELVPISARWNGSTWTALNAPGPSGSVDTDLVSVSCPAENNCTAVGGYDNDEGIYTGEAYADHWNGSTWTIQTVPNPSSGVWSGLNGVSCPTTSSCVAVGYWDAGLGSNVVPLAENWNGSSWSSSGAVLPTGSVAGETAYVSCHASTECEAVGQYYQEPTDAPLAEAWNGSTWTAQPAPDPLTTAESDFNGVSCPTSTACVATGASLFPSPESGSRAFAEVYSGSY